MKHHDLMNDPFYAQLIHVIESTIVKIDKAASQSGFKCTDSLVKSALNKARRLESPDPANGRPDPANREEFIQEMANAIAVCRQELFIEGSCCEEECSSDTHQHGVSHGDWVRAISAVEASLKIRRSPEPGGRDYLDFIQKFVTEGRL